MLTYLIIILGILLLLYAIFFKKHTKLRVALGMIGIILLLYGGFSYGSIENIPLTERFDVGNKTEIDYPIEDIQIISPVKGDSVNCRILTMGVYPKGHEKDIWVLLKPSDDKYYPQSDYTNTSYKEDGKWQVVTRFGGSKNENYELIVYETDSLASSFFSQTIKNWKADDQYPGLEAKELPENAKKVDEIQVTLERDCRVIF